MSIFDTGNHAMRCGVLGPQHFATVLHHHRLAVHPSVPHGLTSSFLAASLRALRRDRPETLAVVTYADLDQGHRGTVYQATNALFTGTVATGNLYLRRDDGTLSTMQGLKHVGMWSERREVARERGWTEHRSRGKHRYVYLFGSARRGKPVLRWATLPYPKAARPDVECGQTG